MEYKLEKPYPLYKLIQEEVPDRHSGYNIVYTLHVKVHKDAHWYQLYSTFSKPWAEIAMQRFKEIFDIHIFKWLIAKSNEPVMFEVDNQVYKSTYVFPDHSCICGETIAGNQRYGEFNVDPLKFDYIRSMVFFYYKGDCLLKSNQLFLDGKLLLDSQQLDNVCKEIEQDKSLLDSSPDKLLIYIANNYDDAKTYTCEGYTNFDIQQYK